ncbi:MAG TPA: GNAT family N-acetyltransferase [Verrucomicrobiae bacterium]|jgi:GNAT superfamily N-acetyltransferase
MKIQEAKSKEEINSCFPVMHELRPHLDLDQFLESVQRMKAEGYRLVFLADPDVRAVAGFRKMEMLAMGVVLYVDDLATLKTHRSKGYGKKLLSWLVEEAKRMDCKYLELDSGVKRLDAHRFYEREGLQKVALHFSVPAKADKIWSAQP